MSYTILRIINLPNGHFELMIRDHKTGIVIYYDTTP